MQHADGAPAMPSLARRWQTNLALFGGRVARILRAAPRPAMGGKGPKLAGLTLAALAFILFTGALLDPPSIAWASDLPSFAAWLFREITDFGKSGWALTGAAIIMVLHASADWSRVDRSMALAWREMARGATYLFAAVGGAGILVNILKVLFGRARPALAEVEGVFAFSPLTYGYLHASFPSGHATTAGAVGVAALVLAPRDGVAVALLMVPIAISRAAVGAHYPSDIAAGFLLGGLFAYGVAALAARGGGFSRAGPLTIRMRAPAARRITAREGGIGALGRGLLAALGVPLRNERS